VRAVLTRCRARARRRDGGGVLAIRGVPTSGPAAKAIASAICGFCDTDFLGGRMVRAWTLRYARGLGRSVAATWPASSVPDTVRLSCVRRRKPLVAASMRRSWPRWTRSSSKVAIETNGTLLRPTRHRWMCKPEGAMRRSSYASGDELKLVYPQEGAPPETFRRFRLPALLAPADGRTGPRPEHGARRPLLLSATTVGRLQFQRTSFWDSVMRNLRNTTFPES